MVRRILLIVNRSSGTGCSPALVGASGPAAVIVGGGGGTLRAVVEGICDAAGGKLPGARQVRLGALRMGSGNVVARRLGVALEPVDGMRQLVESLSSGRTLPCAVIRCTF